MNDFGNGVIGELHPIGRDSVLFQSFFDKVTFGDFQLFHVGIAVQLDDLHSVKERSGDGIQRVCGSDEEHFRQVERHFYEVVAEADVLFGIQHFQQRACGVALVIRRHFIDFIHQEDGVHAACLHNGVYYASGHCSDIGLSVPADLGFVAYTAQRKADELFVHRPRYRRSYRGFTHSGRTDKADYRASSLFGKFSDGKSFDKPLLYLFEPVVIFVQHPFGFFQILVVIGINPPGELYDGIEVVFDERHVGRGCRRTVQTPDFAAELFLVLL